MKLPEILRPPNFLPNKRLLFEIPNLLTYGSYLENKFIVHLGFILLSIKVKFIITIPIFKSKRLACRVAKPDF